jgi:hypothetical protein
MRDAFNNGLKKLQEKPGALYEVILVTTYFIFLILSIKNNNFFLKELTLCGLIIILAIINAQIKNKS